MDEDVIPRDSTSTPDGEGAEPPGRSRKLVAGLAAATGLVVAALAVVVLTRDDGHEPTVTAGSTTTEAGPPEASATTPPPSTTAPPPTTAAAQPSAADTLAPFFEAAAAMDEQLHAAAAAVNEAGPPWDTVTEDVAGTVREAEIEPVAAAIPAGLPTELLQAAILVYSDLSSRRAAMHSFSYARTPAEPYERDLLAELANGHEAAERFDGDLADARAIAASLPPVAVAAPDSRQTAELLVLLDYVHKGNWGCDSRGGFVVTPLPEITWQTDSAGTVGPHGTRFSATLGPDGRWTAYIVAC